MPTATPSVQAAIDGVHSVLSGIAGLGVVLKRFHTFESDVEYVKTGNAGGSFLTAGSMDLWFIEEGEHENFSGGAAGEEYCRYRLRVRYWSVRTGDADWQSEARAKLRTAADALTDNPAVFAIGGQYQLKTPTGVSVRGPEPRELRDPVNPQLAYEGFLELEVEARLWS